MAAGLAGKRKRAAGAAEPGSGEAALSGAACVLGIDPGLERTGYAVIEMPGGRVKDAGLVRTTATRPLAARLAELAEGMEEVLSEHAVRLLAVEDLFAHYKHPRTAILMGHARGAVLLAAARRGIEVISVPATKIKKALTGNGHASKVQVQRAIMATLGLGRMPEPSDVADALAIACYAASECQRK
ncbi:MAG TPA: crossover junction endodeoxyribonuclease RuvC [Phycisphaerae bacterium]|nr:crossover junction endodeoxyribonuclease RuvC [Phycisphaerae bacterium]